MVTASYSHETPPRSKPKSRDSLITVATCNLNQWALDFAGNLQRILLSCQQARSLGASYRLGPELEICGYGCEDHFYESDTYLHCWESLAKLIEHGATDDGLLCDFGMPLLKGSVRYNCRVLVVNREIVLIRPKMAMADGGNYRESRYFVAYRPLPDGQPETFQLPLVWKQKFGQSFVPFGNVVIKGLDGTTIGCESCEELWTPQAAHIQMALAGVEVIGNGSGSHHELRKLKPSSFGNARCKKYPINPFLRSKDIHPCGRWSVEDRSTSWKQ